MGETARIDRRRERRRRGGERVECWSNLSGDEKISARACERWMHRNNEYHLIASPLSLPLSLAHTYTLTPNFPHFNPNPTDSSTVRLRIYSEGRESRLFLWDCLVRAKTLSSLSFSLPLPQTKSSEYTSISFPSTADSANYQRYIKVTRVTF